MDPTPCDNAIYEEVKVEPTILFENKSHRQVSIAAAKIENGGRKCKKGLLLNLLILFALLFAIAGTCVALSLEITKLKSDITSLNGQIASSFQQLHSYINRSYQQLEQLNESIDSTHEQFNKMVALQLNSSIDMLYQQLGQHNDSIDSAYQKLSEKLNTSIDILYQQSSQQNASVGKITQQLNTSVDMIYQQLNQQNTLIDSAYQQLRQEYTALDNRTQQLNTSTQLSISDLESYTIQYLVYPSCAALPPSSPSGYYWVRASNDSAVSVYCDMTLSCGGVTGGWMRVAELDMTNNSYQCPSGLRQRNDTGYRTCVPNSDSATCSSVTFLVNTFSYSKVCGRIIGYQYHSTNAFINRNIDTYYVDGVSLTHGNPRQHIWTFAAAAGETGNPQYICPCTNTNTPSSSPPPEYVGNDYFCDTGSSTTFSERFYYEDPLWDGAGCGPLSTCCSFNDPPWFYKQLPQHTTDDIEMRVCRDQGASNEDIALEMVDVFIQ